MFPASTVGFPKLFQLPASGNSSFKTSRPKLWGGSDGMKGFGF